MSWDAVERRIEHVDVAGDLPPEGNSGFQCPPHEARSTERGEQRLVEPRRAGEQPDEDAVGGVEGLPCRGAGAARHVGDDGHRVLRWLPAPLIDRGDDQLDAAVGGLHHLIGNGTSEFGDGGDELIGGDRQRRRVEDLPVEEAGDLVQLLREESSSNGQASAAWCILDPLDEELHLGDVELLDVVDDDMAVTERFVDKWAELATETQRSFGCRSTQ